MTEEPRRSRGHRRGLDENASPLVIALAMSAVGVLGVVLVLNRLGRVSDDIVVGVTGLFFVGNALLLSRGPHRTWAPDRRPPFLTSTTWGGMRKARWPLIVMGLVFGSTATLGVSGLLHPMVRALLATIAALVLFTWLISLHTIGAWNRPRAWVARELRDEPGWFERTKDERQRLSKQGW